MKKRIKIAHKAVLQLIEAPGGTIDNPFRAVIIDTCDSSGVEPALIQQVSDMIYEKVMEAPSGAFMSPEFRSALDELVALSRGWLGRVTVRRIIRVAVGDCFATNMIYYTSLQSVGDRYIYDLIVHNT